MAEEKTLHDLPGIETAHVTALNMVGVRTPEQLYSRISSKYRRKRFALTTGIPAPLLAAWYEELSKPTTDVDASEEHRVT